MPPSVLRNNDNGTFTLDTTLTVGERAVVAAWTEADVDVIVRDVDMDGHGDLELLRVGNAANAYDQIVFGGRTRGAAPRLVKAQDEKFRNYHYDLVRALNDSNYFDANAPRLVTGQEPAQRAWYGSIIVPGYSGLTFFFLAQCAADNPGYQCNLSNTDPVPCVRTVELLDEFGQVIGQETRNVCSDHRHVWVYIPGSVQVTADYSVFDEDARESKQILDRLLANCSLFTPNQDSERLNDIVGNIYGIPVGSEVISDGFWPNSTAHPPAPGDHLFDRRDLTFHHYDTRTRICKIDQPNCNESNVSQLAEEHSHPSYQMQPLDTRLDGQERVMTYFTHPLAVTNPLAYTWHLGLITQQVVSGGYWDGAIQNVTEADHKMYPGTVTRKIFRRKDAVFLESHGIGVNRTMCIPNVPAIIPPNMYEPIQGLRMISAASNDIFGEKTFKTLDRAFVSRWRSVNGYSSAAPTSFWTQSKPTMPKRARPIGSVGVR